MADAGAAIDANDPAAAGRRFIDYWMGEGAWRSMPESRQLAVAASVVNVRGWGHALFNDPTPVHAFSALETPVLLLVGAKSPPSSRAVSSLLARVIPNVTVIEFPDLGHMGPLTHPAMVNDAIAQFLGR